MGMTRLKGGVLLAVMVGGLTLGAGLHLGLLAATQPTASQPQTAVPLPVSPPQHEAGRPPRAPREKDVWTLDFRFKDLRRATVMIPGQGRKAVWYLHYQVLNPTGQEHAFVPDFELVEQGKPIIRPDQVSPAAQQAIQAVEAPAGRPELLNSVTIASRSIPARKPGAAPEPVNGVATWVGLDLGTERIRVFVAGLSNAWQVDLQQDVLRRRALQLDFRRQGKEYRLVGPAQWSFRALPLKPPVLERKR
jgi:hypothetical protein